MVLNVLSKFNLQLTQSGPSESFLQRAVQCRVTIVSADTKKNLTDV